MPTKTPHPPRLADRFLQWFCSDEVLETLQGDLYELYEKRREKNGKMWADFYFITGVISACRSFAFNGEKRIRSNSNIIGMYGNYIKGAFRQLLVRKFYSAMNILGLVIGLTSSIYILLYVQHELSYDGFQEKGDRIYRVISRFTDSGIETDYPSTQIPLATELQERRPEIELAVRIVAIDKALIESENHKVRQYEQNFCYAEPTIFDLFTFKFIEGDPGTALNAPNTAVVTSSTAKIYFQDEDPIGRTFRNGDNGDVYQITGVIEDLPENSHLKIDALLSYATFPSEQFSDWGGWFPTTYLLLKSVDQQGVVEGALADIVDEFVAPQFEDFGVTVNYWLQPLADIHLASNFGDSEGESSDVAYIYILSVVGFLSLVLACINYMNLATALASKRAREVGVRKTMGSFRKQLISLFLVESSLTSFIAYAISIVLVVVLLPAFNQLADKQITLDFLMQPRIVAGSLLAMLFVGVAGGWYPAFYLSGFNPAKVLKGNSANSKSNGTLRRTLVVVQFSVSIAMLISTLVVYDQLSHMQKADLGFKGDQVVSLQMPDSLTKSNYPVLRNRLKAEAGVSEVSSSSAKPGSDVFYSLMNIDSSEGMINRGVDFYWADYDFLQTMGLEIKEGRNFSRQFATDTMAALVNQAMVARMQWDDPIGKHFEFEDGDDDTPNPAYTVVGVINDYHQQSLHSPISPLAIFFKQSSDLVDIKISGQDIAGNLAAIEAVWAEVNPGKPFSYSFLDEDFESQYYADEKRGQVFTLFSVFTMVIASLGLIGLVAFTVELKIKEIGIRKVLGASITQLWAMLCKEFLVLVGVACFIAMPVGYYIMYKWLQNFSYQTDIGWHVYATVGLGSLFLTLTIASYHAIKAALANPVNALRTE
jgi:putative ABC transport system permease protein